MLENNDYLSIVYDILEIDEFNSLDLIEHHGTTRFEHSLKVSYHSYKICKKLKLDYIETARAGLLHDFFLSEEDRTKKERFKSTFNHNKKALDNSLLYFELSKREKNIIKSHMFPFNLVVPLYPESVIVSLVDKCIGTYEFLLKFKCKILKSA